jgi:hypothetical protein
MVRVKFLIFALLALGLGLSHLYFLSKPMGERALEDGRSQASAGVAEVVRTLEARRGIARALALKLVASPDLVSAVQELSGPEAATAERFARVRAAAEAALPDQELQGGVIGVVTEGGSWHARTGGEPSSDPAELDVKALAQADGLTVGEAFGAPHAFAAVPVVWKFVRIPGAERLETRLVATLVVGVPLLPEDSLDTAAMTSGVAALALVKEEAVVASGGMQKSLVEGAQRTLEAGRPGAVVQRGQSRALGPVKLPVLTTGKDYLGGQAPLMVGSRRALEGTPYEVIALASPKLVGALAAYQYNALLGLAGLLGVSVLWTVLMGSGKRGSAAAEQVTGDTVGAGSMMGAMPAQPRAAAPEASPVTHPGLQLTSATPVVEPAPGASSDFPFGPPPQPAAEPHLGAEPSPAADSFVFPPPPEPATSPGAQAYDPRAYDAQHGYAQQEYAQQEYAQQEYAQQEYAQQEYAQQEYAQPEGSAQAFGSAPMPFEADAMGQPSQPPGVATAAPRAGAFRFEELPTAAYSLQQAADPYAAAAALDSPETTRVQAIPRELLQASARPSTQELPVPSRPAAPPPPAPSVAPVPWGTPDPAAQAIPLPGAAYQAFLGNTGDPFSEEEFHFQEVFREFVLTRERCQEPSDGLTYDKFVQKLRKNKEQLVQKYACRTVKFQVYVKEGKAALKATPVKD